MQEQAVGLVLQYIVVYKFRTCVFSFRPYVDRLPKYELGDVMGDNEVDSDDAIY